MKQEPDINQKIRCIELIITQMDWSAHKAMKWWHTENSNFGGASPQQLWIKGKGDKVESYIKAADNTAIKKQSSAPAPAKRYYPGDRIMLLSRDDVGARRICEVVKQVGDMIWVKLPDGIIHCGGKVTEWERVK